jgi:hypothetical protein
MAKFREEDDKVDRETDGIIEKRGRIAKLRGMED